MIIIAIVIVIIVVIILIIIPEKHQLIIFVIVNIAQLSSSYCPQIDDIFVYRLQGTFNLTYYLFIV